MRRAQALEAEASAGEVVPLDPVQGAAASSLADVRPVRVLAIDDGHSETKCAWLDPADGQLAVASFPSRTIRGYEELDPSGRGAPNVYATYDAEEPVDEGSYEMMMVVPRGRMSTDKGENRTQDYPTSDRNRVLVHHAIDRLAAGASDFIIGTTLPHSDWHGPDGRRNDALISAKKRSIRKAVYAFDRDEMRPLPPAYRIAEHSVYSEGTAAFFDAVLDFAPEGGVRVNEAFAGRFADVNAFLVVDIGGKTTDLVYGSWDGNLMEPPMINVAMSQSLEVGALGAADDLEDEIRKQYKSRGVVDRETALFTREVPLFGKKRDVGALADAACRKLFNRVLEAVRRHAGDGSHLAYAMFVGGGAELLVEHIRTMFDPDLVYIPERPRFANVRGMLKMMEAERGSGPG